MAAKKYKVGEYFEYNGTWAGDRLTLGNKYRIIKKTEYFAENQWEGFEDTEYWCFNDRGQMQLCYPRIMKKVKQKDLINLP